MYVNLATLYQSNFCYLLQSIIISNVHGFFHSPLACMRKTMELKNFAKNVLRTL